MDFWEQQKAEKQKVKDAANEIIKILHGKVRLDEVFAHVMDKHSCPSLYMEWVIDRFWALQMPKLMVDLQKIYKKLVKEKFTEKNKCNFNDADDNVFYIPNRKNKVIVHTAQSFNHLYIWEKKQIKGWGKLHVRKFYDTWEAKTSWDIEEESRFKEEVQKSGYAPAIRLADSFTERYADDFGDYPYPYRYGLNHYKKNGFEVKYGDGRDKGYILSWEEFHGKVENSMYTHGTIKLICECFVPSILTELFEGTDDAISTNDTARNKKFDCDE